MIKKNNEEIEDKRKKKDKEKVSLTSIAEKNDIIDNIELEISKLCPEEGIEININID